MKGIQTTILVATCLLIKEGFALNHVASNGDSEVMGSDSSWSSSSHSNFHHFNSGSSNFETAEISNGNENKSLETILKGIKELRPDIDIFAPNAFDNNDKIKVNGWQKLQSPLIKTNVNDNNPTGITNNLDNLPKASDNPGAINPPVNSENLPNMRQDNSEILKANLIPVTTIDNQPFINSNPISINPTHSDTNPVPTNTASVNHWFGKITSSLNSNHKHQHPTDVTEPNSNFEVKPTSTFTVTASSYLEESISMVRHSTKSQSSSKNSTSSESSLAYTSTKTSWYIYLPLIIYLLNRV